MLEITENKLIQFTNLVNECCDVIEDDLVEKFLTSPHSFFNNETPLDEFNRFGVNKILRLLYFIDIEEADVFENI